MSRTIRYETSVTVGVGSVTEVQYEAVVTATYLPPSRDHAPVPAAYMDEPADPEVVEDVTIWLWLPDPERRGGGQWSTLVRPFLGHLVNDEDLHHELLIQAREEERAEAAEMRGAA